MTPNTNPIYPIKGDVSVNNGTTLQTVLTTAAADYTGISANNALVHTASASGSFVRKLRFVAAGTNVASVARIYANNGLTNATAANNKLIGQVTLPATTATNTGATVEIEYNLDMALNPDFRIYVGLGTTVAAGWSVTAITGQYQ